MFMMRFDMRVPGMTAAQIADQYQCAIEMAQWAEGKGCVGIGISEHHCSEDGYTPSPLVLASAMAAVTKSTPIMIAAALLNLYDPVRLAEDMIVLDYVSRGRVSYVCGLGYREVEYQLHGVDFEKRGAVADEKLAALLAALKQASEGTAMPRVTPASFTPGRPMINWGGGTKAAARRAGHNGVGFVAQTSAPGLAETYAAAAREKGFEPGLCMLPPNDMPSICFVHPDANAGWREVGQYMLVDATSYAEWNKENPHGAVSLSQGKTVEALQAERGAHRVYGIDEAAAQIKRWGRLGLHPLCGGCPPELAWKYLRRVVDDVIPALAKSS